MPATLAVRVSPAQQAFRDARIEPGDRPGGGDQRTQSQRDRDRILNTTAFRRLAGVTQVVSAAEGEVFHNRLTHSLEVAQIGRRIGEHVAFSEAAAAAANGGLDPETVEAACLAHDLGHPPFGHVAEAELDTIITQELKFTDGFEGNPQSFRIVAALAARHVTLPGLNLTRATLNALSKYPWTRDLANDDRSRKWGAYPTESRFLAFAREGESGERRCLEAEIMDWSDDIGYAVHDLEDFYRAGFVPFDRLTQSMARVRTTGVPTFEVVAAPEVEEFVDAALKKWDADPRSGRKRTYRRDDAVQQLQRVFALAPSEPYDGTFAQRSELRTWTSSLIGDYVRSIHINPDESPAADRVVIAAEARLQVDLLKEMTWYYVIQRPSLAAQQFGQRRVIRDLFTIFHQATQAPADSQPRKVLPIRLADALAEREIAGAVSRDERLRFAADAVASLTEQQALDMHRRLTGNDTRSVLDPIVR